MTKVRAQPRPRQPTQKAGPLDRKAGMTSASAASCWLMKASTKAGGESVVLGINGEALTLKWRDYPREKVFVRRRTALALLPAAAQ